MNRCHPVAPNSACSGIASSASLLQFLLLAIAPDVVDSDCGRELGS